MSWFGMWDGFDDECQLSSKEKSMNTCVTLDCPFICYCKEYNYTVDRGERCEHMEQIIRKATRFDKQRKKAKEET